MKKIIILTVFLITSQGMYAQNAGYMGKHFILSGELSASTKVDWDFFKLQMRSNNGLHFEALLTPKFGLGVGLKQRNTTSAEPFADNYFVYSGYMLSSTTYSLDCYFYRRGGIIPLGRFFRLSVLGIRNKTTDFFDNKVAKSGIDPNSFPGYDQYTIANTNLGIGFTFGYRRIIANHIVVSAATQFGFCLGNLYTLAILDDIPQNILTSGFKTSSYFDNRGLNLIALNISVGGIF